VHLLVCIFFSLGNCLVVLSQFHGSSSVAFDFAHGNLWVDFGIHIFFSRFESASENLLRRLICSVTVCVSAGFR
jgi:hypothetical protein